MWRRFLVRDVEHQPTRGKFYAISSRHLQGLHQPLLGPTKTTVSISVAGGTLAPAPKAGRTSLMGRGYCSGNPGDVRVQKVSICLEWEQLLSKYAIRLFPPKHMQKHALHLSTRGALALPSPWIHPDILSSIWLASDALSHLPRVAILRR